MRTLSIVAVIVCLLASPLLAAGKQYAVLVGVEEYQHSNLTQLEYAVEDVTELAAVLTKTGYTVTLLTDDSGKKDDSLKPTRANIEKQIHDVLAKCTKEDTVLVAFAGHGLQFTGQKDAYFCPVDARPFDDETKSMVSISKVYSEFEKSFAGVKVILVDACRNDPDPGRGRGGLDADAAPRPPRGVAALFSCSAGQRAFEHDELKHGVFFHYILEGLKKEAVDKEGTVTFDGLALYVRRNVPRRVQKLFPTRQVDQFPNLKADLIGTPPILARVTPKKKTSPTEPLEIAKLREKAEAGDAAAQYELGNIYYKGKGINRDYKQAIKWLEQSAAKNNASAQNTLGYMYQKGQGVEKDMAKSIRYYRQAADQGHSKGHANLGYVYLMGIGVDTDLEEALKWFRMGAKLGNANSQTNIGYMYEQGLGVKENHYEAVKWYRLAANQGDDGGQFNLGTMYEHGRGVTKNKSTALKWYRKSADQGYYRAKSAIRRLEKSDK